MNLYFFSNNKNYFNLICKNEDDKICYYIFDPNLKIIESMIFDCKIPEKIYSIKDKIFLAYEENGFENVVKNI